MQSAVDDLFRRARVVLPFSMNTQVIRRGLAVLHQILWRFILRQVPAQRR